jgi:hypothetical protein
MRRFSTEILMISFLMTLVVMRFTNDIPREAGGKPKEKPPDLEPTDKPFAYATAFYWEMYGATAKAHNAIIQGAERSEAPAGMEG